MSSYPQYRKVEGEFLLDHMAYIPEDSTVHSQCCENLKITHTWFAFISYYQEVNIVGL
jgi:hypothetical protein